MFIIVVIYSNVNLELLSSVSPKYYDAEIVSNNLHVEI